MIRRINLYGVPCSGKSRTASFLFSELIEEKVELVHERIKPNAYRGIKTLAFGQVGWLHKQLEIEETYLYHGADLIITDCPLHLSAFYADGGRKCRNEIRSISDEFERVYPSLNIYLRPLPYKAEGRFQSEQDIKDMDIALRAYLEWSDNPIEYQMFDARNKIELLKYVRNSLKLSRK